jgi:hypothetical protein
MYIGLVYKELYVERLVINSLDVAEVMALDGARS